MMFGIIKEIYKPFVIWAAVLVLVLIYSGGCKKAPSGIFTIGIVNDLPIFNPVIEGFKAGMAELGYVEGKDIIYVYNGIVDGNIQIIDNEIRNIQAQKINLLATAGNHATLRAKHVLEGTDTPILFMVCNNPVKDGIVEGLINPGGNVTGVATTDTTHKALEWLKKIIPSVKKVYMPYNPEDMISITTVSGLDNIASQIGIELIHHKVRSVEETVTAIENLEEDIGAVFRIPSPTLDPRNSELSLASIRRGLPMGSTVPSDSSVLIILASDFFKAGVQSARLASLIHKGLKPADIPVESTEVVLTINLKTAEKIGIKVPDDILAQATTIIH